MRREADQASGISWLISSSRLPSQYRSIGAIGYGIFIFTNSGSMARDLRIRQDPASQEVDRLRTSLQRDIRTRVNIETYDAVGLLDSTIAIASFRESVPFYCIPDLSCTFAVPQTPGIRDMSSLISSLCEFVVIDHLSGHRLQRQENRRFSRQ
jgi:hypothetical protein